MVRHVRWSLAGTHVLLIILCAITLFPLAWMGSTAFKDPAEIFGEGVTLVPTHPTLENFSEAFNSYPVGQWILNSALVSVGITLAKLAISLPAAFAFAQLRFRGQRLLFGFVIGAMIVPYVITIIPNYTLVSRLHLINTLPGVIIPSIAFTGFYVFLLRQAMLAVPAELYDAARVDGAGTFTLFTRITLPLVKPAVGAVTVLAFLSSWNLYMWPLLILDGLNAKTLPVGLQFFASDLDFGAQQWGALMAATLIAVVPPLLLYVLAQRHILSAFVDTTSR